MSNIAIQFDHVGKMYQLGVVGTGTLSNDIKRWWVTSVLGKEDPFLRVGQTNDRTHAAQSDYVYALRDITFNVQQGDVVGIIGKNGAGKSTLLKLLSRITAPTTGTIKARGRIASLLEVGTGFHPELTGRENIYMNGAIMGMTKKEIDRKLDEIIDFSGCEMYIDTPVKRYSSGMSVRLGFAVAAFLEPEILVVDEVLAVGDAEFQRKAIGKMNDVATNSGRTVLFVSHNMDSVRALCKTGVVLKNGMVEKMGTADECVDFYMGTNITDLIYHSTSDSLIRRLERAKELEYVDVRMLNDVTAVSTEEPLELELTIKIRSTDIKKAQLTALILNSADTCVGTCYSESFDVPNSKDTFKVHWSIRHHNLGKGRYTIDLKIGKYCFDANATEYDLIHRALAFQISYVDIKHQQAFVVWPKYNGYCAYRNSTIELL